jgi:hypothetical protein
MFRHQTTLLGRLTATAVIGAAATAAALTLSATSASAAATVPVGYSQSVTYTYSQGANSFTVPAGTYSLYISATGGSGGGGATATLVSGSGGGGGLGQTVTETLAVTPGEELVAEPGSAGGNAYPTLSGPTSGGPGTQAGGNALLEDGGGGAGGSGGGGAASAVVGPDGSPVLVAAGGGGGGGGGTYLSLNGGNGGNGGQSGASGSQSEGGAGGSGAVSGNGAPGQAPGYSAGGGGGGGGGYNGGAGGSAGSVIGGGGGGGGGVSWASSASATMTYPTGGGDGSVTFAWTPGQASVDTLTSSANPSVGNQPVTFTDTIKPVSPNVPPATGTVTIQSYDVNTALSTPLATVAVTNGVATWTTTTLPAGSDEIYASYNGDSNYVTASSTFVDQVVKPGVPAVSVSPKPVAFGTQPVGTSHTREVTVTDTGTAPWSFAYDISSNPDISFGPSGTCPGATIAPKATCTLPVVWAPPVTGPDNGTITLYSDTDVDPVITVTGTAINAPTVTKSTPASGPRTGGTTVTITGTNLTDIRAIHLGSTTISSFTCPNSTTCQFKTPAGKGTGLRITATNPAGTSTPTTAAEFSY